MKPDLAPISLVMFRNVCISEISGTFSRMTVPEERQAAAIKARELFLEPCMRTEPFKLDVFETSMYFIQQPSLVKSIMPNME